MNSFFFNIINNRKYCETIIYEKNDAYIKRVDISNGLVYFNIKNIKNYDNFLKIFNIDRMLMLIINSKGSLYIKNQKQTQVIKNKTYIYSSTKQDFSFCIKEQSDIFILFVADFFLKRYLLDSKDEIIDYLFAQLQTNINLKNLLELNTDTSSEYLKNEICYNFQDQKMKSLRIEHKVIELLIHVFSFLNLNNETSFTKEEYDLALLAKQILLTDLQNPLTIKQLAHKCSSNDFKLKKCFKKVYKSTIYKFLQKHRLEQAKFLLKDKSLNIGQVALKVGYKHQGNFSKLFFETYGLYPKDL